MKSVHKNILEQVIAATAEPLVVVRIDQPDWPVVLSNPAFATLAEDDMTRRPFADVIEKLAGRREMSNCTRRCSKRNAVWEICLVMTRLQVC